MCRTLPSSEVPEALNQPSPFFEDRLNPREAEGSHKAPDVPYESRFTQRCQLLVVLLFLQYQSE